MSLKAFHIIFVTVSTILCVGFGFWGIREYTVTHDAVALTAGILSLFCAAALVIYGRWFLRKLKRVSFL